MAKKIFWGLLSFVAAGSLAVVVGVIHPSEKINALWLVVCAASVYALSYRYYAAFLAARVLSLDSKNATPAVRLNDGMDYHPTNKWVVFGHHFAAIAGAGPLIGPMLAAQFGYLPGFLWILVGSVLGGAVHDMVILAASVRRNGRSLAQIARDEVGPVGGAAASLAIIFIIIVALAGLGLAVVNALAQSPWGTFTIAATIPIALFMGFYMRNIRPGRVGEGSAIGGILLLAAVVAGHLIPGSTLEPFFNISRNNLVVLMAAYGFIASVLPVWALLAPRDYISTFLKIGTIMLLAAGVVLLAPEMKMPAVTRFAAGGGPIIPGPLFPFMFITIACGAISGFHSLVSSGTSPKMISSEADIPLIGFGAMITEGFVAVMAIIAAGILVPGDYFAINTKLGFHQLAAMGFPVSRIGELSSLVGTDVHGRPGGAVSLAVGMASILSSLPAMKGLMPYWYNFALMFEALFILTTIDAGTRVARYLLQETGAGVVSLAAAGKMARDEKGFVWGRGTAGVVVTSALVVVAWAYPIYSGDVSTIWPMFGVANQLLSAIAFGVGTTIIIKSGKARHAWVTFLPMVFMYVTTFAASYELTGMFMSRAASAATEAEAFAFRLNSALVVLMALLALVVLVDMLLKWQSLFSTEGAVARGDEGSADVAEKAPVYRDFEL
ncbi:MAG: carbon starvation protein A [Nitrospinae bacterium]|nr:carbon starvation protein A [Nitrospinota bacterium]